MDQESIKMRYVTTMCVEFTDFFEGGGGLKKNSFNNHYVKVYF